MTLPWVEGVRLITTEGEWVDLPLYETFPVKTVKIQTNGWLEVDDVEIRVAPQTTDVRCVVIRLGDVFIPIPENSFVLTKTKQSFHFAPATTLTPHTSLVCVAFDHVLVVHPPDEVRRATKRAHHSIEVDGHVLYGVREPYYKGYGFSCVLRPTHKKTTT